MWPALISFPVTLPPYLPGRAGAAGAAAPVRKAFGVNAAVCCPLLPHTVPLLPIGLMNGNSGMEVMDADLEKDLKIWQGSY